MDFANRGNRPNAPQQTQASAQNEEPSSSFKPPVKKSGGSKIDFGKLSSVFMLFTVTILAFVLVLGLVFIKDGRNEDEVIQTDKYQAVFLDSQDGQVYFGRLGVYNSNLYVLTDIYYVRVENPIQPQGTEAQQPNISLAKLGNELHGPQDTMFISRDKVLYWENLKDDGQVVTAIKNFQTSGEETPAANQQPQQNVDQSQAAPTGNADQSADTQPADTPQQNDTPRGGTQAPDPNLEP